MTRRSTLKPYAVDIVKELRREQEKSARRTAPYIDLADVVSVSPKLLISPIHTDIEYDDEDLIFQINPDTLEVGDTVIIGRDPSGQPVLMGIADSAGGPITKDITELRSSMTTMKRAIKKLSVSTSDNFLPKSGGTMTGNLVMDSGTYITLIDAPVNNTDAVNKAYVDQKVYVVITDVDSPYSVLEVDNIIFVDPSASGINIVLPSNHSGGKEYTVKNTTSSENEILIYSADSDLIDGKSTYVMDTRYQSTTFISDGNNWNII